MLSNSHGESFEKKHLSSSCRLVVPPLGVSSRQLVVAPSSLGVLSLHRPLVHSFSLCWLVVALHVLAPPSRPLVVVHRRRHQTPSNAAAISNTSVTAAIECRLYRPPLPQLPPSITTVKCQRPSSSITAVKRLRPPSPPATADVNFHRRLVIPYP